LSSISQLQLFRNLGSSTYAQALEVLILRDCLHLKEVRLPNHETLRIFTNPCNCFTSRYSY